MPLLSKIQYTLACLSLILAAGCAAPSLRNPQLHEQPPAQAASPPASDPADPPDPAPQVPIFNAISDPLEPLNRALYSINEQLITFLIDPLARAYSLAVPDPARQSIKKAGINLQYPGRLINLLLQGRLKGAGVETGRFLVNTTAGVLGLFDPATRLGLNAHFADFGQTFARYGAGAGPYLCLPFYGPSSVRDAAGLPLDNLTDPASFLFPADVYFSFNQYTFVLPQLEQVSQSAFDPYAQVRDFGALDRERQVTNFKIDSRPSDPVPSLEAVRFSSRALDFASRSSTYRVRIPATGRKFPYSLWLHPGRAPLVIVLPGIGAHRIEDSQLALAQMLTGRGFSVLTISNSTNWEFMETAATTPVPGYTPADAEDIFGALTAVCADVRRRFSKRISATALMGLSTGGTDALYLAGLEAGRPAGALRFDRILAIAPPVDPVFSLRRADDYYNAPLRWKPQERPARIKTALYKAVMLINGKIPLDQPLPFDRIESEYLVGLNLRFSLRDMIFVSQRRQNLGVIKADFNALSRESAYREIAKFSFVDYYDRFVCPYYLSRLHLSGGREELIRRADLRSIEDPLRQNDRVRVLIDTDDFLIGPQSAQWLRSTLGSRLTVLSGGGHIGNLYQTQVQNEIIATLADLKTKP